ncbi:MAG: hypothetical protein IJI22_02015 [Bacilli bacterium]|nr:hypothetical protein [Bacilli bacterium]
MDNKEYLNEENYQKANKKVNKIGTILLVIGVLMVVSAIIIFIVFLGILKKPALASIGGPLLVFGLGFAGFGGQAKFLGHAREINAYMTQQRMPVAKEGVEKMAPSMGVAAKEIAKGVKEGLKEEEK